MSTSSRRNSSDDSEPRLSPVCLRCRERHLKCKGGPICDRCDAEGVQCLYTPTRRGQRRPVHLPDRTNTGIASSGTCATCRDRHLKCSGGPRCTRCAKENAPCVFQPSRRGQRKSPQQSITSRSLKEEAVPPLPLEFVRSESFEDVNAFQGFSYFLERTSQALSGYYDQDFWSVLTLQVSHEQPAIKHILIALGSLHWSIEAAYSIQCEENAEALYYVSLKHYSEAIRLLKDENASELPIEVVLISYILFICFETMQYNTLSAMNLLSSGFTYLAKCHNIIKDTQSQVVDEVSQVFSRVSLQVSTFIRAAELKLRPHPTGLFLRRRTFVPHVELPPFFSSLQQARSYLESMTETGYSVYDYPICDPDLQITPDLVLRYSAFCDSWYERLNDFLNQNPDNNAAFQHETLQLRRLYHFACIMAPSMHDKGELRFDNHIEEFRLILSLCVRSLKLQKTGQDFPTMAYKIKLGVIHGLFLIALYCRCPNLRRNAVNMLASPQCCQLSEYSYIAAKVSERIIDIEEHGLIYPSGCEDVPGPNRIRVLEVDRVSNRAFPGPNGGGDRDIFSIWLTPRPPPDLSSVKEMRRFRIRYARSPWDLTSVNEEVYLDIPSQEMGGRDSTSNSGVCGRVKRSSSNEAIDPRLC